MLLTKLSRGAGRGRLAAAHRREPPACSPALDEAEDRQPYLIRHRRRGDCATGWSSTSHYKRVDGTSFAAPIVTSIVAQMLEANPGLTPRR